MSFSNIKLMLIVMFDSNCKESCVPFFMRLFSMSEPNFWAFFLCLLDVEICPIFVVVVAWTLSELFDSRIWLNLHFQRIIRFDLLLNLASMCGIETHQKGSISRKCSTVNFHITCKFRDNAARRFFRCADFVYRLISIQWCTHSEIV